jgi:hypothetical protein
MSSSAIIGFGTLAAGCLFLSAPAHGAELLHHLGGVGVVQQFGPSTAGTWVGAPPAQLSVKVPLGASLEVSGLLGFRLGQGWAVQPGVKANWIALSQKTVHLYATTAVSADWGQLGLPAEAAAVGIDDPAWHGLGYRAGIGFELFPSDFDHLGLSLELGLGGTLGGGSDTQLTTLGTGFGGAGIHYYF